VSIRCAVSARSARVWRAQNARTSEGSSRLAPRPRKAVDGRKKRLFESQPSVVFCRPMARYIFITGGVVSSLGKGLPPAALGGLLQARGYAGRLRKLDPYLNVDPGTMSPYQHGEVFVTDDGAETDLDLGHYERFPGVPAKKIGQHYNRAHLSGHPRQ